MHDFYLRADSGVIDKGVNIPGINDDRLGVAPDMGAYEFGMAARNISSEPGRTVTGWNVGPLATFQLRYTTNLSQPAWNPAGLPVQAERPLIQFIDPSPSGSQRFYRLQRVSVGY